MALKLYFHPLASFCHKALIALYENGTAFEPVLVNLGEAKSRAAFEAIWPMAKMPVLRDEARGRTVAESTIVIEYLDVTYPGPTRFLPADPDGAWQATLRDRQGRVRASLRGQRGHRSVQFRPQGRPADARAFELAESTEVGLDWAALQTYATWTDDESAAREGQTIDPSAGQWDGHIRRDARARRAVSAAQLGARLQRVRTEFPEVETALEYTYA